MGEFDRPSNVLLEFKDGMEEVEYAHVKHLDSGALYCLTDDGTVVYHSALAWHTVKRLDQKARRQTSRAEADSEEEREVPA